MLPRAPPGSFIAAARQCRSDGQRQHISAAYPRSALPWQHIDAMHPEGAGRGNISPKCIPGLPAMAIFRRGAFSGGVQSWRDYAAVRSRAAIRGGFFAAVPFSGARRWQDAREMRSPGVRQWQDLAVVRFRGSSRGEIMPWCVPGRRSVAAFSLHAFPKGAAQRKAPLPGSISPPCIRNEPASARYSRHASEKPCKHACGDAPREDLATKGPFSLRGPFRSCTARRSCRRSALERERIGQSQKIAGVLTRTRSKVVTSY